MVPVLGVKALALETVQPRNIRQCRAGQSPHPRHQYPCTDAAAIAELQLPALQLLVEHRLLQAHAKTQVRRQLKALCAMFQVGTDFRLGGELAGPVGVGRKGKRIDVGLHITGAARVVVVAPGAAQGVGLFGNKEVVEPGLLEFDRHAQAGEA